MWVSVEAQNQPRMWVLSSCPLCFLRQGLSLAWSLLLRLVWLANELCGSHLSLPPQCCDYKHIQGQLHAVECGFLKTVYFI